MGSVPPKIALNSSSSSPRIEKSREASLSSLKGVSNISLLAMFTWSTGACSGKWRQQRGYHRPLPPAFPHSWIGNGRTHLAASLVARFYDAGITVEAHLLSLLLGSRNTAYRPFAPARLIVGRGGGGPLEA
ncbi:hypothetical protein ARUE_113p00170 (plasmid) [Arthrobacter sp. Rue61a]|nr:hypothetical protein ARUE_113p00170 [Arthrobacter sp. Rue61a]